MAETFKINRAPVLTLWAAIVAERLGFDHDEALTLGRAVAGLNAYAKGKRLGVFKPSSDELMKRRSEIFVASLTVAPKSMMQHDCSWRVAPKIAGLLLQ